MPGVRVLSTLAFKGLLENHRADLEHDLGPLELVFDATQALVPRVRGGEKADLLILTEQAMGELAEAAGLKSVWPLGRSGVGVAVRSGAPRPDIGSVAAFKQALLDASSVAHSKVGASGLYFVELIERLGVAARIKRRVVVEKGPVGLVVAAGEAELGVQQLCELAPVAGIDIVGPLPEPLQRMTAFAAGIPTGAGRPDAALRLIEVLRSPTMRAAMIDGGFER